MKIKLFLLFQILLMICEMSCSSYKRGSEPWEGITENTMRVTIAEFFPFEAGTENENLKIQINERLNQRASLLIASYISINLQRNKISHETDVLLNKLINEIISCGKILNFECSENNHCTAHSEYDLTELHKKLESLNN